MRIKKQEPSYRRIWMCAIVEESLEAQESLFIKFVG